MKKSVISLSLILGLFMSSFAMMACNGDDDEEKSLSYLLVGTWYVWHYADGDWNHDEYTEITFNKDFTCTSLNKEWYDNETIVNSDKGIYNVEGNKLSIWWNSEKDEDGPWTTVFTIKGNKMITTEADGTTWTKK